MMRKNWQLSIAAVIVGCGLWNCGGGGGASQALPSGTATTPARAGSATARFTILVPAKSSSTSANRRSPAYLSASMQSLVIQLTSNPGFSHQPPVFVNLTPSNPECTGSPLVCTVAAPAYTGANVFQVTSYDQQQTEGANSAVGNALSQNALSVTIAAGTAVNVPVTLDGVTAGFQATPAGPASTGGTGTLTGSSTGLTLTGSATQLVNVQPLDAQGNAIIGPGSPSITMTSSNPNVQVRYTSGIIFALQGVTNGSATLTVTATGANSTDGIAPFALTVPVVYSSLAATPTPAPTTTPTAVPLNSGTIYVGVNGSGVYSLAGATPAAIIPGAINPEAIALGPDSTLFVSDGANNIKAYLGAAGSPVRSIGGGNLTTVTGLAVDPSGNLYVAESGNAAVQVFSTSNDTTPVRTLANPSMTNPVSVTSDHAGNIWVLDFSSQAFEFQAGTSTLMGSLTATGSNQANGIAVDAAETVYEGNMSTQTVTEFLGGNSSNSQHITGFTGYQALTVDASGNLLVLTTSGITTYAKASGLGSALTSSSTLPFSNGESIVTHPNLNTVL